MPHIPPHASEQGLCTPYYMQIKTSSQYHAWNMSTCVAIDYKMKTTTLRNSARVGSVLGTKVLQYYTMH